MDMLQFIYFMHVMEYRSFTKAAKVLFTSQSNVSKQMSKLKSELGVDLFERNSSRVIPTAAGRFLYDGLAALMPEFDTLILETKKIAHENQKVLRIGLCDNMDFDKILSDVIDEIRETQPDLQLHIETYFVDEILNKLIFKELDIIIIFSVMEADAPNLVRYPLNRANNMIYFSKKHPLYQKKDLVPLDFRNETFYQLDSNARKKDYLPYSCLPFAPKKVIKAKSPTAIFLNVESNLGVTVLGQNQTFFRKDSIATVEVDAAGCMVGSDAIWLSDNTDPALQVFLKHLYVKYPS